MVISNLGYEHLFNHKDSERHLVHIKKMVHFYCILFF